MLDVLGSDYIRTARAKGLSPVRVVFKHALRNAIIPVVALAAVELGFMLGGSVVIESIFVYNGIGKRLIDAINQRDYPVMQGVFIVITISVIFANLMADLLYSRLDPRIRVGGGQSK